MTKLIKDNLLYVAWATALASMAGSLYFSEVLGFAPCVLCWYQRIAMYPLVLIMGVGIVKKDRNFHNYALPLSIIGGAIAFYQNLLYYSVIPERFIPCISGVSCTARYIQLFGFADIPLLSLVSFIVITVSIIIHKKSNHVQRN
jgi:disulfide bond formation protein DsbB